MPKCSMMVSQRLHRILVAGALSVGVAQPALAQVTYIVDRAVGNGRVTGTITTTGNVGVLSPADIVSWNLVVDADGNGTGAPIPAPPNGALFLVGSALSASPTELVWDFSTPGFNIFQLHSADFMVTWQMQAFPPAMIDELLNELPAQAYSGRAAGPDTIATSVVPPLELTADTTLTADRSGPLVIAADNVSLDCAGHSVAGNPKQTGILVAGRVGITITHCTVSGFGEGIVLEDTSQSTLSENTVSGSTIAGIRLAGSDRNTLTGNLMTLTRNPHGGGSGLVLSASSQNRLSFNAVDHSDLAGVSVAAGSQENDFTANVSSYNGGAGFDVAASSTNSLLRNTAVGNRDYGFVVRDQAKRNKLLENSACLNQPADATEIRDGRRGSGNVWALNLFCSPSF
jgi:parallel beta-helix repeat protein